MIIRDYESIHHECPLCDNPETYYKNCNYCEDGLIDCYEEDPVWYERGDTRDCDHCNANSVIHWCQVCNYNINEGLSKQQFIVIGDYIRSLYPPDTLPDLKFKNINPQKGIIWLEIEIEPKYKESFSKWFTPVFVTPNTNLYEGYVDNNLVKKALIRQIDNP